MKQAEPKPESVDVLLRALRLPAFVSNHHEVSVTAEKQGWGFQRYLYHLAQQELDERRRRKVNRLLKKSELPGSKTLSTFKLSMLPTAIRRQVPTLCEGGFVDRAENLLAFGLPGRGKTHLVCAIGHELIHRGYSVLFTPAFKLVQRLLAAKRDLRLEHELKRLDRIDAVILDDLGYVQQDRNEMEVLFTFLGERYERRTVMITSNLVFSQWDQIFKDPMTTACAVDRVVHHSIILELTGPTVRGQEARKRNQRLAQTSRSRRSPRKAGKKTTTKKKRQ
jgi:DNA replication protein DnaC